MNFIKSSSGNRANIQEVEEVWDIIEKHKTQNNQSNVKNVTEKENDDEGKERSLKSEDKTNESLKKKKKSDTVQENEKLNSSSKKRGNKQEAPLTAEPIKDKTEPSKFDYKAKILEILSEKQSIPHKKLQKKIVKAYVNQTGQSDCEERIIKKFNKKLKKISNVGMEDDRVFVIV